MRITWALLRVVAVTLTAQTPPAALRGFGPPIASAELAQRPQTKGAKGDPLNEFRDYMVQGCCDIVQPEIMYEGPTMLRRIAALADGLGKMCIPHVGDMRLGTICDLDLIATWANCPYIEVFNDVPVGDYTYPFSIFEEPPLLDKQGYFSLPQGPGLGMTIKKDLFETA